MTRITTQVSARTRTSLATTTCLLLLLSGCVSHPVPDRAASPTAEPAAPLLPPREVTAPPQPPIPVAVPQKQRASDELWERIRDGFALERHEKHARVAERIEHLRSHATVLLQVEHARLYLPYVTSELRARELPMELALLPFIESTMDPYAFSAGGAAGIWQLVPATARRFGIEISWWYDGRRGIVDSTAAALDYLNYLHERFDDWLLAIAAYNAGEGRVQRALARSGPQASYWELSLPRETERYVPTVLALAALVAKPERHGLELPRLEATPAFAVIELDGQIDLRAFAERADLPTGRMFELNAGLNRGATPPSKRRRLLVPKPARERVEAELALHDARKEPVWHHHEIDQGETLSGIAQASGTSVAEIRSANDLDGHLIRPGQRLLIPQREIDTRRLAANPLLQANAGARSYEVRRGDSLWQISKRFGTTVDTLVRLNRLDPGAPLRPGQRLTLPPRDEAASGTGVSPDA